jgi:hypothetical protein
LPRFQYLALQNWRRAETGGLALRRRAGVSACTCREFDNTEAMAAVMRISSMCGVGQGWKARSVVGSDRSSGAAHRQRARRRSAGRECHDLRDDRLGSRGKLKISSKCCANLAATGRRVQAAGRGRRPPPHDLLQ